VVPAPVPQTGQTTSYAARDDGAIRAGVVLPSPRFTDNGDGTVRDNATGLIWLKNANCFGLRTWAQASMLANNLANGQCGLTDGSSAGDWRLPNIRELLSLVDFSRFTPAPRLTICFRALWEIPSTGRLLRAPTRRTTRGAWTLTVATVSMTGRVNSPSETMSLPFVPAREVGLS
jgi:hypothetical protein